MNSISGELISNALEIVIDVLWGGRTDRLKLLCKLLNEQHSICDMRFLHNYNLFLSEGNFDPKKLRKFSERLEEQGNKEEYAMMVLGVIDSIDSKYKARCIANLTQSVVNDEIDVKKYLRLMHTLKLLIEGDLTYLDRNIQGGTITDIENLDDYLTYGIIRPVNGGYAYTERAHDLIQFGIKRGHDYRRPSSIPQRDIFSY